MQRACAAALVRKGVSIISNPGTSNDDKAALSIIKNLGAEWKFENEKLIKSVAADATSHTYFVSVAAGKIKEEELPVEMIR